MKRGTVGTEHRVEWPPWWDWELELTPHVERRTEDRDFTEIDLRLMLETAHGYRTDPVMAGDLSWKRSMAAPSERSWSSTARTIIGLSS